MKMKLQHSETRLNVNGYDSQCTFRNGDTSFVSVSVLGNLQCCLLFFRGMTINRLYSLS